MARAHLHSPTGAGSLSSASLHWASLRSSPPKRSKTSTSASRSNIWMSTQPTRAGGSSMAEMSRSGSGTPLATGGPGNSLPSAQFNGSAGQRIFDRSHLTLLDARQRHRGSRDYDDITVWVLRVSPPTSSRTMGDMARVQPRPRPYFDLTPSSPLL